MDNQSTKQNGMITQILKALQLIGTVMGLANSQNGKIRDNQYVMKTRLPNNTYKIIRVLLCNPRGCVSLRSRQTYNIWV